MPTTTETHAAARRRLLEEEVLLLAPSFGSWKGMYQLPKTKTTVEMDGEEVDNANITTPRAKLITDTVPVDRNGQPWQGRIARLASRHKRIIETYSISFPIHGVRIIPTSSGASFFRELDDVKRDMQAAADEFVADYDGIMRQIKRNTPENVFRAVEHKIPRDRAEMRAKFYIDVVPVEIAASGSPRIATRAALEQHQDLVRESAQRKIDEALDAMFSEPRQQLAEALTNLKDVIRRSNRVSSKSFKPVYDAIAKMRAFRFVANQELLDEMDRLEQEMGVTPARTLGADSDATAGFSAALDALMDEVENAERESEVLEQFGRQHRSIQL